jgi:hypothetical protein
MQANSGASLSLSQQFTNSGNASGAAYQITGHTANQLSSIILQQQQIELHDRFESQYFAVLLRRSLIGKYMTSQEYYNSKVSADIMYNEQRHIVSIFKEYLIYDDFSEYLKRFYTH